MEDETEHGHITDSHTDAETSHRWSERVDAEDLLRARSGVEVVQRCTQRQVRVAAADLVRLAAGVDVDDVSVDQVKPGGGIACLPGKKKRFDDLHGVSTRVTCHDRILPSSGHRLRTKTRTDRRIGRNAERHLGTRPEPSLWRRSSRLCGSQAAYDRLVVSWEESGSGHPAVVFVHGLSEDRRVWSAVVNHLERDRRCIRLDLRGHGDSPWVENTTGASLSADVAEVIAAAHLDAPPIVVGHSLGGSAVTMYATQAEVHAVVNVDQPMRFGDFAATVQPFEGRLRGSREDFIQARIEISLALGRPTGLSEQERRQLDEWHRGAVQEHVLAIWSAMLEMTPEDLTAFAESVMPAIRAPYVEIHGDDHGRDYIDWLQALVPQARVETWPGNGHYPHLGEPERLAALILSL